MVTLDTAIFVKDNALNVQISKLNKIRAKSSWGFVFFSVIILIIANFRAIAEFVVPYIGGFFVAYMLLWMVFGIYINALVKRGRAIQTLDPSIERDRMLSDVGLKYDKLRRRNFTTCIVGVVLSVLCFICSVAVGLSIDGGEGESMPMQSLPLSILCVIVIFTTVIVVVFSKLRFVTKELKTISALKTAMLQARGLSPEQLAKQQQLSYSNMTDNQKIFSYLYPDDDIRKKIQRCSLILIIPSLIIGIIGGLAIVLFAVKDNPLGAVIIIGLCLAAFAATIAVNQILQARLVKRQRVLLDAQPEKYIYHIELANETKAYATKSNRITYIMAAIVAAAIIIATIILPLQFKIISLLVGALTFFVACIVVLALTQPAYRKIAQPLYQKIEDLLNTQNAVTVAEGTEEAIATATTQEINANKFINPFIENSTERVDELMTEHTENKGEHDENN